MKKQKFFIRLFAAYTLVAILYTTIVVTLFYNKNNEIIQLQMNNKYEVFLEQTRDKNDITIMTSLNLVRLLMLNSDIIEYGNSLKMNGYNVTRVFNELNRNLSAFSSLGCTLGITNMKDDLIITPGGTFTNKHYNEELGLTEELVGEVIEPFRKGKRIDEYLVAHSKELNPKAQNTITILKKEIIQGNSEILVYLSFPENTLSPRLDNYDGEAFAILKEENVVALKTNMEGEAINSLLDKTTIDLIRTKEDANRYSRIEKSDYFIHFIRSKVLPGKLGWYYIYITPKNVVNKEIRELIVNSVMVQIVLLTLGMGLALFIAKKMYKPIRNTLNVFSSFSESGTEDELTFIQETASRINTANERLKEIIQNNRLPLKHKFLRDLLYGLIPTDEIQEKIQEYELDFLTGRLNVVIFEFANLRELDENFSREAVLTIESEVLSIIQEQLKQEMKCEIFELDYKRFIAIIMEIDADKTKSTLNNVVASIEASFEIVLMAVVGELSTSVKEIEKSFNSALGLLEYRYALGKKAVITAEDLRDIKDENYYYPLDLERDLISYVIRGKRHEVDTILTRVLDENLKERKLGSEVLSQFIFAMVSTVNRIVQQMNKKVQEIFEQGSMLYLELKMCEDHEELKEKVLQIFDTLLVIAETDSQKMSRTAAEHLLEFIHNNYNKDISLLNIAEYFSLTPAYVSTLFKSATGENFKDYLNIYRVKKAKEILDQNKDIRMKDLAELVGCNSMNTFFRIFKKYEGLAPGQYIGREKSD